MSGVEQPRRLTAEELAELDSQVNAITNGPLADGPLPPLESDSKDWVAARWREFAEGKGPRAGRRSRWSAKELKRAESANALVDVFCGSRLVARACTRDGALFVITEVMSHDAGVSFTWFSLAEQPVVAVACRGHEHHIRSTLLADAARRAQPGRPRSVKVMSVI